MPDGPRRPAEQAMDLYNNDLPAFTTWVIDNDLLEEPFVVIDVGVQGGPHSRWKHLKDKVRIYGFDAIPEVVEGLNARKQSNETYFAMALGDEEGTRDFYVRGNGSSYYGSSLYEMPSDALQPGMLTKVPITRLDTLFAKGVIPPADHIKVDCDGHDPEVIRGASQYLAQSNVLCVTIETAFTISPQYPRSHFVAISDILTAHRLWVFDLNLMRTARPSYVAAKARHPWPTPDPMKDVPDLDVGAPGTIDALFCRDFVFEQLTPMHLAKAPGAVTDPTTDKIIKSMINFELHGLMDCAVELAEYFRPLLSDRLDPDTAVEKLLHRPTNPRNTADVTECLRMMGGLRTEMSRIAEMSRIHAAEREAATARIMELLAQVARLERFIAEPLAANLLRRLGHMLPGWKRTGAARKKAGEELAGLREVLTQRAQLLNEKEEELAGLRQALTKSSLRIQELENPLFKITQK
jgi:FkbM family methyltransferase